MAYVSGEVKPFRFFRKKNTNPCQKVDNISREKSRVATRFFWLVLVVTGFGASVRADGPGYLSAFHASKDTLLERGYVSPNSTDEVWLINRGDEPLRIDSISILVDRNRYPTLSMDFGFAVRRGVGWENQQVFYWYDGKSKPWLSYSMVIPPRDSARVHYLRLDRCAKCNAQPSGPQARDMAARVRFFSARGVAELVVRAWYRS